MNLIVGLGNPGPEYRNTRHNIGFAVVDELARRGGAGFRSKFKGELARSDIAGRSCLLLKPLTYMNRSGISVALAREYFDVSVEEIVIIHDEVDFPFGRLRVKDGGGHAGHNGLRSIVDSIGTRDFSRVRCGVGRPVHGHLADHVLSAWRDEEREWLADLIDRSADAVARILSDGVKKARNDLNGLAP